MSQINSVFAPNATELGRNPNALGAYRGTRHDAGFFPSGAISYSHFRGRRRRLVLDITTAGANLNMRSLAVANGWDQVVPIELTVRIQGACFSNSPGAYAFDTDDGYPAGSVLRLVVNGGSIIVGRGGDGGLGGGGRNCGAQAGNPGGNAGPALIARANIPLTVENYGTISGGGGGGGGGGGDCDWHASGGNGGGGAGFGQTNPNRNFCGVTIGRAGWPGGNGDAFSGGGGGGNGNGAVGDGGRGGNLGEQGRWGYRAGEPGNRTTAGIRCPQPGARGGYPAPWGGGNIVWQALGDVRSAGPSYVGDRLVTTPVQLSAFDPYGAVTFYPVSGSMDLSPSGFLNSASGFITIGLVNSLGIHNHYVIEATVFWEPSDSMNVQCVAEDTMVLMADSTTRRISGLVAGDLVSDGEGGSFEVVGLHVTTLGDRDLLDINGLVCSPDHPVMTVDGWKAIDPEMVRAVRAVRDAIGDDLVISRYDAHEQGIDTLRDGDLILTPDTEEAACIRRVEAEPKTRLYAPILKQGGHYVANNIITAALRMRQRVASTQVKEHV